VKRWLVGALALALLSGCGGKSGPETPTTGQYAPIEAAPPLDPSEQDPDAGTRTGDDLSTVTRSLGNDRYQLEITNVSHVGFVNVFTWSPPPTLKVTKLVDSDDGACALEGGVITCRLALHPPTCTCKGDGGSVKLDFIGKLDRRLAESGASYGAEGSVNVTSVTPVPYVIPSTPTQDPGPNADLPICKRGQDSTREKPCVSSG
jgi:hypothetical protein